MVLYVLPVFYPLVSLLRSFTDFYVKCFFHYADSHLGKEHSWVWLWGREEYKFISVSFA